MYCIFPVLAKNIVWPYRKILQIWVLRQVRKTFLPPVHQKKRGAYVWKLNDFTKPWLFYSPRLKAPKKIKRTMFFWYKQFWTKPWKKMDWSTSFFCNLSSKQQITPNLILGKEVYKALNCISMVVIICKIKVKPADKSCDPLWIRALSCIDGKFICQEKSFTWFALQSECCNFNQWDTLNYNRSCDF